MKFQKYQAVLVRFYNLEEGWYIQDGRLVEKHKEHEAWWWGVVKSVGKKTVTVDVHCGNEANLHAFRRTGADVLTESKPTPLGATLHLNTEENRRRALEWTIANATANFNSMRERLESIASAPDDEETE